MDTFLDMQGAVQSDLTIGSESSLYPLTTVKLALNRAYRKAGTLFRWPQLEDSKKTSTEEDQEYYDYPRNWRPDSIWKLTVDGVRYGETPDGSPLTFDDYLSWKEDNPSGTEKKWANQWTRYFIHPTPTTDGDFNITIWGIENVATLTEDDDITIFSYSMPEGNEAIVLEAVAILKSKGEEEKQGQFRSDEAKQILAGSWDKVRKESAKYEKIQPFFDVPDLFGKNIVKNRIGGF
jgi:hypothetical protein